MAAEDEFLRLLFSMSGIRSMYSMFLSGPHAAQSRAQLQSKMQAVFAGVSPGTVANVAQRLWDASTSAAQLRNVILDISRNAGPGGLAAVASGQYGPSQLPVSVAGAGQMPGLSIPGSSGYNYVIPVLATYETITPAGTREYTTVQIVTVWTDIPLLSQLISTVVAQAEGEIEGGRYNVSIVLDVSTGQPNIAITPLLVIDTTA